MDERGDSPFAQWFDLLDATAAAKVAVSLYRMEQGNLSRVKGVGGRSKKRQAADIEAAISCWQDYKKRKRKEVIQ
ncbi:MAG: hypothetical protein ACLQVJ_07535 [Syntrophobacteraceae bacterium]